MAQPTPTPPPPNSHSHHPSFPHSFPHHASLPHASDPTTPPPPHASDPTIPSPPQPPRRPADPSVLAKLESLISSVVDGVLGSDADGGLEIPMRVQKRQSNPVGVGGSGSLVSSEASAEADEGGNGGKRWRVRFPGGNKREGRRFVVLFQIVELVHRALMKGVVISKRNIYYQNPMLFGSQRVVDRYVDVLACSLGVQRAALNVTAAAKGLVAGNFTVTHGDGTVTRNGVGSATMVFSEIDDIRSVDASGIAWVLVIEKESTFRTLASSRFHETSEAGNGIIVTAKGYPDLSTRAFLHLLSSQPKTTLQPSSPPIYALVDFDPDGISIMSTYKYGSWTLSHETAKHTVPRLRWLGVQSTDLVCAGSVESTRSDRGLLPLSARDRGKATAMLKKHPLLEHGPEAAWRSELQVMLMLGLKAEMELLEDRDGGMERWLEGKLLANDEVYGGVVPGGRVMENGDIGEERNSSA